MNVGFHAFEVWGGATFDVMTRFLNEDPWERVRLLKSAAPKTPFMMLLARSEPRRLPQLPR